VVTALYRRYRPENFAELIGQSQVTDPLRTALRNDRVNHAYLFSGPRGCGKTTSARILARCLNCAEGPTDTPCGVCPSCVELSRDGSGSLDVVEIDAASHNGVDDARDLRERAVFAPARDRYKIFILDEAHMVTPQGFNALLKIVEEPPEHVKFIFATTEPEKVIGTIRSRTHHYPFRLVPPAQMLEYVQQLSESEKVSVDPGVLPLVVRAGGGSVRDTLSLLDQLIAGSEGSSVQYERAVALLGYTHGALLDEVIDALGSRDAAAAFSAVDRVIQTGQDPRRFVEDLLERLRDLIVVAATADGAAAVLRGIQQDELDRMAQQAAMFGAAELSRTADVANAALTEMTGATSPRLHLELMVARVLVPSSDESERGTLVRVERLERRIGVDQPSDTTAASAPAPAPSQRVAPASSSAAPVAPAASAGSTRATTPAATGAASSTGASSTPSAAAAAAPSAPAVSTPAESTPAVSTPGVSAPRASGPATPSAAAAEKPAAGAAAAEKPAAGAPAAEKPAAGGPADAAAPVATPTPVGPVTLQQVKDAWPEILASVQKAKMSAWTVLFTASARDLRDDNVLVLSFPSQKDVDNLKQASAPGQGVGDHLKKAVLEVLGITPKLVAVVDTPAAGARPAASPPVAAASTPAPAAAARPSASGGWATVSIPGSDGATPADVSITESSVPAPSDDDAPPLDEEPPEESEPPFESPVADVPKPATSATPSAAAPPSTPLKPAPDRQRYGEAVVREILGASFIEELAVAPRVVPQPGND
jgi:DNA polymerase-3 subunit gamma/tau